MKTFAQYIDEALTMQQRHRRGMIMKKNASKIAAAKKRNKNRIPSREKIEQRAHKQVRIKLTKKYSGGTSPADLTFSQKETIEKRLAKMKPKIHKMAMKLVPIITKAEHEKKIKK